MEIRNFAQVDFLQVAEIYKQGINTHLATFETRVPEWIEWDATHLQECRIAAFEGDLMTGWAALTKVSGRCVYAGVAEVSVYVNEKFRGKGVGKFLLQQLIESSEKNGIWTLQAGIFDDNKSSIELHKSCGFRIVGYREKIGQLNSIWKDTIIMERRSKTIGV